MNNLGTNQIKSCPSRLLTQDHRACQPPQTVARKKRISYECHPDLLNMQDLAIEPQGGQDGVNLSADAVGGLTTLEDEDLLDTILEQAVDAVPSDVNVDTPQRDADD